MSKWCLLLCLVGALTIHSAGAAENRSINLAIFRFQNSSLLALREDINVYVRELFNSSADVNVLPTAEMERQLRILNVEQRFNLNSALELGTEMGLDYVLLGRETNGSVSLGLVDVLSEDLQEWSFVFDSERERNNQLNSHIDIILNIFRIYNNRSATNLAPDSAQSGLLSSLTASITENRSIRVEWDTPDTNEIMGYSVYRQAFLRDNEPRTLLGTTQNRYFEDVIDFNRLAGSTYYYTVDVLNSDFIPVRTSLIADIDLPSTLRNDINPPLFIGGVESFVGTARVRFVPSRIDSSLPLGFSIYRTIEGREREKIAEIAAGQSSNIYTYDDQEVRGIQENIAYAVASIGTDGIESPLSDSVLYQSTILPELRSTANLLLRESRLAWTSASRGDGYAILRRSSGETEWVRIAMVEELAANEYIDTVSLQDGVEYEYSIIVFDEISESLPSNTITITTKPPLSPPSNLQASSDEPNQVTLSWSVNSDEDTAGYNLYRSDAADSPPLLIAETVGREVSTFIDLPSDETDLVPGHSYVYSIASRNLPGSVGQRSDIVIGSSKSYPEPISTPTITVRDGTVTINWTNPEEIAGDSMIRIYRRNRIGSWTLLDTLPAESTEYADLPANPELRITYRIEIVDSDNLISESRFLELNLSDD